MKEIKTAAQAVTGFKRWNYGDDERVPKAKELADSWGVRFRRTADTKQKGPNVWEVSTSYFYTSQNSTVRVIQAMQTFGAEHGFKVTPLDFWHGTEIEFDEKEPRKGIRFAMARWPKTSWASLMVRIEKVETE